MPAAAAMSDGLVVASCGLYCWIALMSPVSETTVVMPRSCSSNDAMEMLLRCSLRFYQVGMDFADFRVRCGVNLSQCGFVVRSGSVQGRMCFRARPVRLSLLGCNRRVERGLRRREF